MTRLMLHSGAAAATREQVAQVVTPEGTETWWPVAHEKVIELVLERVQGMGFGVKDAAHGLWNEGARYFGLFELVNGREQEDYGMVLGIRNSHDKSFPAALALGSRVFVCDNLAFSGEIVIARKHTKNLMRDLPGLVARAAEALSAARGLQEERIELYKLHTFERERDVHDLVIQALDAGVIANQRIPDVLKQWREPVHEEFQPRTVWSLFNAFTEVLKSVREYELARRTVKLHGLLDVVAGMLSTSASVQGDAEDVEVEVRL